MQEADAPVRCPGRGRRLRPDGGAGRDSSRHRSQRRGQIHRLQPDHQRAQTECGAGYLRRRRRDRTAGASGGAKGNRAHLPALPHLSCPHRARECPHGGAGTRGPALAVPRRRRRAEPVGYGRRRGNGAHAADPHGRCDRRHALARRPATARDRHGDRAEATAADAGRAHPGLVDRGDRPGGADSQGHAGGGRSERAAGRARHGSGVQARRQHHGAASRPRDRRRLARRRARQRGGAQRLSRRSAVMLRVENLHTYYGQGHVLQGVNLEVPAGRIAAVLGRNGVGKTTTLRSIVGLTPPRRGHVVLAGQDVAGWPPHRIVRVGLGYVPEGRMIFPDLTVVENIQVAQRVPARLWTMERLFGLFPALAERRRSKGSQLSGGEQQMLAVARALVTDPRVILLDEPSQGLAPLVVEELTRLIMRLRDEGVSLLLVEQNLNLAEAVADVVYVMVKGQMVYHAPLERFRTEREEVKARYLTL